MALLGLSAVAALGALATDPTTLLCLAAVALAPATARLRNEPEGARDEGAWRVLPLEGAFEILYTDAAGRPSLRRLTGRELKIGPGKVLLGGIDRAADAYRGFRADRIRRLYDYETGEVVDRNIVDWLIRRATPSRRGRAGG